MENDHIVISIYKEKQTDLFSLSDYDSYTILLGRTANINIYFSYFCYKCQLAPFSLICKYHTLALNLVWACYWYVTYKIPFWNLMEPNLSNYTCNSNLQSDLALFGRLGGGKPQKVQKRKAWGYVYLTSKKFEVIYYT